MPLSNDFSGIQHLPWEQPRKFPLNVLLKKRVEDWIDSSVGDQCNRNYVIKRLGRLTNTDEMAQTVIIPADVCDIIGGHHHDNQSSRTPEVYIGQGRWPVVDCTRGMVVQDLSGHYTDLAVDLLGDAK